MTLIRPATVPDTGVVCNFVIQLAKYENLLDEVTFDESQYRVHLFSPQASPYPEVAIAEYERCLTGFALFIHILQSTVHLEDLFVNPNARGKGIGLSLLAHVTRVATQRGASQVEWSCLDWNTPSLEFYKSIGATPIPNRSLFRISGDALEKFHLQPVTDPVKIQRVDSIPSELDQKLCGIELLDESGCAVASLFYSLTFTTFKATPVFLVCEVVYDEDPADLSDLITFLIDEAGRLGYSRIDIRVNESTETSLGDFLVSRFGAFKMAGWIPFSLHGEALEKLSKRL
jgi:GNAT superfamily N-acetyltransferase